MFALKRVAARCVAEVDHLAVRRPRHGRLLTLHSVGTPVDGDVNGIYQLSPNELPALLDTLVDTVSRAGLRLVPFPALGEGEVAVTVDDGYTDALERLAPEASRRSVPIHVFVTASHLDGTDRRYLDPRHLHELAAIPGVTIGAHGNQHRPLTALTADERARDLTDSQHRLEDCLGHAVTTMSYPFGAVDAATREAAGVAGFTHAACSTWGFNPPGTDPLMLRRLDLWAGDGPRTTRLKTLGHWNWFRHLS